MRTFTASGSPTRVFRTMNEFFQDAPKLTNQYHSDPLLRSFLERVIPKETLWEIEPGLIRLGERAVTDIYEWGKQAESSPPLHVPYDPWGRRVDEIRVSDAWKKLERTSAEEGLVSLGYKRKHGALSRIHQFARVYLFGPSSAIFSLSSCDDGRSGPCH